MPMRWSEAIMRHFSSGYSFETKARLNAFVIGEIVDALYPEARGKDLCFAQNSVSIRMISSSDVHDAIGQLARAMESEIGRQREEMKSYEKIASRIASCAVDAEKLGIFPEYVSFESFVEDVLASAENFDGSVDSDRLVFSLDDVEALADSFYKQWAASGKDPEAGVKPMGNKRIIEILKG